MGRKWWITIGGVILALILLTVLPWWVPVIIIAAAIAVPVVMWRSLDPSQRRRIRNMRDRGQLP